MFQRRACAGLRIRRLEKQPVATMNDDTPFRHVSASPLTWPFNLERHKGARETSRFKAPSTVHVAVIETLRQLSIMGVSDWNVIISSNLQLRRDGLPYSKQPIPQDPGVAVYFRSAKMRPTVLALDKYLSPRENLWAVAKTIEALRGIERWGGGTFSHQAFTGFTAIPPPSPRGWREILDLPGAVDRDLLERQYRRKAQVAHPDKGGSAEAFREVRQAYLEGKKALGL